MWLRLVLVNGFVFSTTGNDAIIKIKIGAHVVCMCAGPKGVVASTHTVNARTNLDKMAEVVSPATH